MEFTSIADCLDELRQRLGATRDLLVQRIRSHEEALLQAQQLENSIRDFLEIAPEAPQKPEDDILRKLLLDILHQTDNLLHFTDNSIASSGDPKRLSTAELHILDTRISTLLCELELLLSRLDDMRKQFPPAEPNDRLTECLHSLADMHRPLEQCTRHIRDLISLHAAAAPVAFEQPTPDETADHRSPMVSACPPPPPAASACPPPICASKASPAKPPKKKKPISFTGNATLAGAASTGSGIFSGLLQRLRTTNTKKIPLPRVDHVQFSAIVAEQTQAGRYLPLDIFMYEDTFRRVVDEAIANRKTAVTEEKSGYTQVEDQAQVQIVLQSADLDFCENDTRTWCGGYLAFRFTPRVPSDYNRDEILFTATVYLNGVVATRLSFITACTAAAGHTPTVTRRDIHSAFVSYASQDRSRVATIIQGMKAARPDLEVFFDIENLRSGQRWENELQRAIEERDILFLCWSSHARASSWVDWEWRHALEVKGTDGIEPIPLESPDRCPPPTELSAMHFNSKYLLYTNSSEKPLLPPAT